MQTFEQQLEQVSELISLPEIYQKINRLMADSSSSVDDFAEVIQFDPNLSATVLKVVNSAFYGISGGVDNIAHAVNLLGMRELNIIALSHSALSALDALDYPDDIVPLKSFWRSSLFSGVLSRQLALQLKIKNSERLFVIGLLHEIGHLALYAKFPEIAHQSLRLAKEENLTICAAEERVAGCHYGQIGARLMAMWNLPNSFQAITQHQPTPHLATDEPVQTALLHLAHGYAHKQFIDRDKELDELINPAAWEVVQLTSEELENTLSDARRISADMERLILR